MSVSSPDRDGPRALLVSASIGEGHDGPARTLAEGLAARGATTVTLDALRVAGPAVQRVAGVSTQFDSWLGNAFYDLAHPLVAERPRSAALIARGIGALAGERLLAAVQAERPDVVVSTYPGATLLLGRARAAGRLRTPLAAAITDLASLRWWAHPGVDRHLLIHPESAGEVRALAGRSAWAQAVHGLIDARFEHPEPPTAARAALGLPTDGALVVVSGGGWAVGDLGGAVAAALAEGADTVVVLCGRRDDVRSAIAERFEAEPGVHAWGFTDRMPTVLAAADVLVHSTAGLTVLEALMAGCHVISYGWGRGHIRANNRAYAQLGLAAVAADRADLADALRAALAAGRAVPLHMALPEAADVVLALTAPG